MSTDSERSRRVAADASCGGSGRPPWVASTPSAAVSQLVCVGKVKSNGVSQSLFIDRAKWPPRTGDHRLVSAAAGAQQARPQQQSRAAAAVTAAAVSAAAAATPKVICISPLPGAGRRSHTVIRRATAHHQVLYSRVLPIGTRRVVCA